MMPRTAEARRGGTVPRPPDADPYGEDACGARVPRKLLRALEAAADYSPWRWADGTGRWDGREASFIACRAPSGRVAVSVVIPYGEDAEYLLPVDTDEPALLAARWSAERREQPPRRWVPSDAL